MPRRKFTREFKVSAVKLVNEPGYTLRMAAKSREELAGKIELIHEGNRKQS